jgi:hypothetical protein
MEWILMGFVEIHPKGGNPGFRSRSRLNDSTGCMIARPRTAIMPDLIDAYALVIAFALQSEEADGIERVSWEEG